MAEINNGQMEGEGPPVPAMIQNIQTVLDVAVNAIQRIDRVTEEVERLRFEHTRARSNFDASELALLPLKNRVVLSILGQVYSHGRSLEDLLRRFGGLREGADEAIAILIQDVRRLSENLVRMDVSLEAGGEDDDLESLDSSGLFGVLSRSKSKLSRKRKAVKHAAGFAPRKRFKLEDRSASIFCWDCGMFNVKRGHVGCSGRRDGSGGAGGGGPRRPVAV